MLHKKISQMNGLASYNLPWLQHKKIEKKTLQNCLECSPLDFIDNNVFLVLYYLINYQDNLNYYISKD
jgi:hypothetical protein